MPSKYDPETRAKAVRLVLEHRDDYPSEWAAITAVSKRLGMNAETLRHACSNDDTPHARHCSPTQSTTTPTRARPFASR
jgi:transposase-like protein